MVYGIYLRTIIKNEQATTENAKEYKQKQQLFCQALYYWSSNSIRVVTGSKCALLLFRLNLLSSYCRFGLIACSIHLHAERFETTS